MFPCIIINVIFQTSSLKWKLINIKIHYFNYNFQYLIDFQGKQGGQIGMATNAGQGQFQINSSQGTIRFSQPQCMVSNTGGSSCLYTVGRDVGRCVCNHGNQMPMLFSSPRAWSLAQVGRTYYLL